MIASVDGPSRRLGSTVRGAALLLITSRALVYGSSPGSRGATRDVTRAHYEGDDVIRRLIAGVAAATIVAVPAAAVQPAQAADPVVFTVGILSDIDSLNPFTEILAESYEMFQLQYSTLLSSSSADFTPDAGLAESWEASADGKTWTYTLRPDLVWSDGTPLTANDVVYTFERILNGRYEQRNYGNYVRNITSVTAPDDRTVVMTTRVPSPIMERLAVYILPEHVWSSVDAKAVKSFANEPAEGETLVGSGPLKMMPISARAPTASARRIIIATCRAPGGGAVGVVGATGSRTAAISVGVVAGAVRCTVASGVGVRPAAMASEVCSMVPPRTASGVRRYCRSKVCSAPKSGRALASATLSGCRSMTSGSLSKKSGMSPNRCASSSARRLRSDDLSMSATRGRWALLISKVAGAFPARATDMGETNPKTGQPLERRVGSCGCGSGAS